MQRKTMIGPGTPSVLLAAVIVIISLLSLLSASAARQDEQLSDRAAAFRQAEYTAMAQAQVDLAELDQVLKTCAEAAENEGDYYQKVERNLPEGMVLEGDLISWTVVPDQGRILQCRVVLMPLGQKTRYRWREHALQSADLFEMEWDEG